MRNRKPIEIPEAKVMSRMINPKGEKLWKEEQVTKIFTEVRELESYTSELEKKLKIAVDLLKSLKHGMSIAGDFDGSIRHIDKALLQIKGES